MGDMMEKKLKELVAREDKRNPLTDQQLAETLGVRREEVTLLRGQLNIPDSRERRRAELVKEAGEIVAAQPEISARALTALLQEKGFDLSRHVAGQLLKELTQGETSRDTGPKGLAAFTNLIGWQGSLRTQVQQAKAAVIYPPAGLHTLILGESGVGKSELAEAMYRYSVETGIRRESAPFVIFNCADYAENPQLLISQLFGHSKGAFTGAGEEKYGLVEKADGGLLFLDEVHRLPPEGQEILYSIIDRGTYRRLGETDNSRYVNVMLVAATTERPESSLLSPFRRRIPMVIELPSLRSRPLGERLEIVVHFFRQEANRLGKRLLVQKDVLKALLSSDRPGNVGQLKSDVQVACARGFLNHLGSQGAAEIRITLNELSLNSRRGVLESREVRELEGMLPTDRVFVPGDNDQRPGISQDNIYALPDEIYQLIEEQVNRCRDEGLSQEETSQWVSQELEQQFNRIIQRIENIKPSLSRHDLEKLIGAEITSTVAEMVEIADDELNLDKEQLFFYLAIHLNTALERIRYGKPIVNPQLAQVKQEHEAEYLTALKMATIIRRHFEMELPEDEVGFIALYLRTFRRDRGREDSRVAVLVLSHGRIAREMVSVVNTLLKVDHAHSLDMALTESPDSFLQRVMALCKEIDQGKGILMLVDMGSLITFGEIIQSQLGIPVRVLDRVDLVMVLEATRWAMLAGASLNEIADDLLASKTTSFYTLGHTVKKQYLIATCLSGYGGAEKIKTWLEEHLDYPDLEIKTVGVIEEGRIQRKIDQYRKDGRIAAIVGTIDPEIQGVPFIPFQSVVSHQGLDYLKSLLPARVVKQPPVKAVPQGLAAANVDWKDKKEIITQLGNRLLAAGLVKPGFIESVFEREEFAPTCLEGGIAIPHADPEYVLKPGFAVATLTKPIQWWGLDVDVVFLLALRVSDRQLFTKLLKVFKDKARMRKIRGADAALEIEEELYHVYTGN